ncbi:YceI family protein [Solibacillus silvestris]|uniref:YceI family protein n=1 Tax=Solibacillus silvestris TaxID=76853 RepID=UPI003F7E437C
MTTYVVDFFHSSINFSIKHMMITKVNGTFDSFSAQIEADEIETFKEAFIRFDLDVASVNTRDNSRDQHLISGDFFDADRYPKITFIKNAVEGGNDKFKLHGDLTIKDITKPVTFEVAYNGHVKSPWNADTYGFTCKTIINRKDFNLTYNAALETGGVLLAEQVHVNVELQLNKM